MTVEAIGVVRRIKADRERALASERFRSPPHWTLAQRLARYTSSPDTNGCMLWAGANSTTGYGHMGWRGKIHKAHRLAWEVANGPILSGLHCLHRCDVRLCCNPAHLFLGTNADNMADMARKGRSVAPMGVAHNSAKLTEVDVVAIRVGTMSLSKTAAIYGVSSWTIGAIRRREIWRHI